MWALQCQQKAEQSMAALHGLSGKASTTCQTLLQYGFFAELQSGSILQQPQLHAHTVQVTQCQSHSVSGAVLLTLQLTCHLAHVFPPQLLAEDSQIGCNS